ncbi:probable inactive peptidyl-prolyl cis-trans isomerase-like 6 [Tupaia chinensis]|uniref:probable inactive peptidyl-prolyl cis-trans isomerase-like 6 n=1 Tax=Tupaia chinensis TaxID=246437 RepID=UPI000FFBDC19|nr:probable inactive peptidyl-prolyl cis-trans isomerase-like 6 [Tupaia chinensis]
MPGTLRERGTARSPQGLLRGGTGTGDRLRSRAPQKATAPESARLGPGLAPTLPGNRPADRDLPDRQPERRPVAKSRHGRVCEGCAREPWRSQRRPGGRLLLPLLGSRSLAAAPLAGPRRNPEQQSLKDNYPSKFKDPIIVPLQEFAWDQFLQEKKKELKNETWQYSSCVMCFINDQLLGDAFELQKWAQKVWDIVDIKPAALYDALTMDYATKFLSDTKHNFVFLDICIDFSPIGRLIFELYCDICPKTCKNFQFLCTGKAGVSPNGTKLHYKDSIFHRVVPNGWIQGGDIVAGKGDDGESIYGPTFEDENFSILHNKRGVLGMVNKGYHTNGSQFYITLQATPYLDKKYVAFGQLIEGTEVLKRLEVVPTQNERPIHICRIVDSGDLYG